MPDPAPRPTTGPTRKLQPRSQIERRVACPHCGGPRITRATTNSRLKCTKCGEYFRAPAPVDQAETAPPPGVASGKTDDPDPKAPEQTASAVPAEPDATRATIRKVSNVRPGRPAAPIPLGTPAGGEAPPPEATPTPPARLAHPSVPLSGARSRRARAERFTRRDGSQ